MSDSTDPWPTLNEPTVYVEPPVTPPPPPDYAPPPPPPADRRIGWGLLLGLLAVAIAAAGVFLAWYLSHRQTRTEVTTVVTTAQTASATAPTPRTGSVAVPSVVGLPEVQALRRLSAAGFTPKVILQPSKHPSGTVASQVPAAAANAEKGTVVRIVVSRASTGTSSAPTATSPGATTAAPATTAPTTTAAPPTPQTAQVPDVSGQTESAAVHALVSAGVLPSFVFVPSSRPLGTVVAQAKAPGTTVSFRGHLQVNLSQGPHMQATATVPSVIGRTLTEAVSTLNGAKLRLIFAKLPVTSRAQAGKVVQESPAAGARVPQNAQVLVLLGAYRTG